MLTVSLFLRVVLLLLVFLLFSSPFYDLCVVRVLFGWLVVRSLLVCLCVSFVFIVAAAVALSFVI